MASTDDELAFLRSHGIARLATSGEADQPDVVPVTFEFDGDCCWVGGRDDGARPVPQRTT